MAITEPTVYDIRDIDCYVGDRLLTQYATGGISVAPSAEDTLIKGLKGEVGFNIDPSSAAEITIVLKSTSPEVAYLSSLWSGQMNAHTVTKIRIVSVSPDATGFSEIVLEYAMLASPPTKATNEKESPDYSFRFIGYGYREES